jgi:hypothetical protein
MWARLFIVTTAVLAANWPQPAGAEPPWRPNQPGLALGDNPNPIIWGKPLAMPARQPASRRDTDHIHHGAPRQGNCMGRGGFVAPWRGYTRSHVWYHDYRTYGSGLYGGTVGYGPYYYGNGDWYPYAYPPLYYPFSEDLYGPQAMQRFLGMGNVGAANGGAANGGMANALQPRDLAEPAAIPPPDKPVERATNAQANALAWRFIGFGDAQFAAEKFADANGRYRKASRAAPQLADTWFRQAFALSAMGRQDQATAAIKRGLRINPKWPQSGFDLQTLFGNGDLAELAKNAYLDDLIEAANAAPRDAGLLFMTGVQLHFAGRTKPSEAFLRRAKDLTGMDSEHIGAFLAKEQ